jgi:hypothetical protein
MTIAASNPPKITVSTHLIGQHFFGAQAYLSPQSPAVLHAQPGPHLHSGPQPQPQPDLVSQLDVVVSQDLDSSGFGIEPPQQDI